MKLTEHICLNDYINFIKESRIDEYVSEFMEAEASDRIYEEKNRNTIRTRIAEELDYISRLDEWSSLEDQLNALMKAHRIKTKDEDEFILLEELVHTSYIHRNILVKNIYRFTSDVETALCITQDINTFYHRWEKWVLRRMKNMNEELISSKDKEIQRFFKLIDHMPQKAWVYDPHAGKVMYNHQWTDYTGLKQEDAHQPIVMSAIHPDESLELQKVFENSMSRNQEFEFYCRLRETSNNYRWHLLRGVPIREDNGEINVWAGTYTDIHDQYLKNWSLLKNSEEKIEDLSEQIKDLTYITRDQSNFIYMASHDLKAPLANIQGLVELLKDILPDQDPEIRDILKMIDTALARFSNTLHEISQIVHQSNSSEDVNLDELMKEVSENLATQILESEASIHTDFQDLPSVKATQKNIYTIFVNLLSNSIKYRSPERKPEITIRSEKRDHITLLTYKDNASGMDLDKKDIFKKGARLDSKVEGTGIGLFLVKNIIENMGGKISVQSEIGKGSIFKIFLPQHD